MFALSIEMLRVGHDLNKPKPNISLMRRTVLAAKESQTLFNNKHNLAVCKRFNALQAER